jgi:hypothetical protein
MKKVLFLLLRNTVFFHIKLPCCITMRWVPHLELNPTEVNDQYILVAPTTLGMCVWPRSMKCGFVALSRYLISVCVAGLAFHVQSSSKICPVSCIGCPVQRLQLKSDADLRKLCRDISECPSVHRHARPKFPG